MGCELLHIFSVLCYTLFMRPKPLLLIILDAFGISTEKEGNPMAAAKIPAISAIERDYPFIMLQASGVAVGLPPREAGNSEVGHLTIGSGRTIHHHLPRIISSIHDGTFFKNEKLLAAIQHVKANNSRLHIAGLISSGSVHSYINHLYALLDLCRHEEVNRVFIHVITDGKDAPPQEGAEFIREFEARIAEDFGGVAIASVVGRFYAMDRDTKWDRIEVAYNLMTQGRGKPVTSIPSYLEDSYKNEFTDEFIEPAVVRDNSGNAVAVVSPNDALIFFNFREDSMRQITHAFVDTQYPHFPRAKIDNLFVATMTDYEDALALLAAFPSPDIINPLAAVLGAEGLKHFHVAETEKYAHVTYFFNGGRETPFEGEERMLIPSLDIAHIENVPDMRAREITSAILQKMNATDVVIANYANADMVGHSGNFPAVVQALEALDASLGDLMNALFNTGGIMLITADHGGVEMKRNMISGERRTEHSINPVPLYLVSHEWKLRTPRTPADIIKQKKEVGGILTDIAPTILELLELKKPHEMTGTSMVSYLKKQI